MLIGLLLPAVQKVRDAAAADRSASPTCGRSAWRCISITTRTDGQFFLHHPFDADVIANTGDANSFAEIYWEDKLMPFIGGTRRPTRASPRQGIMPASETIYRCPADPSVRQPFVDDDGQSTASSTAPAT